MGKVSHMVVWALDRLEEVRASRSVCNVDQGHSFKGHVEGGSLEEAGPIHQEVREGFMEEEV